MSEQTHVPSGVRTAATVYRTTIYERSDMKRVQGVGKTNLRLVAPTAVVHAEPTSKRDGGQLVFGAPVQRFCGSDDTARRCWPKASRIATGTMKAGSRRASKAANRRFGENSRRPFVSNMLKS
jgi:hypothetical protein